jgi:hypothetical protein
MVEIERKRKKERRLRMMDNVITHQVPRCILTPAGHREAQGSGTFLVEKAVNVAPFVDPEFRPF